MVQVRVATRDGGVSCELCGISLEVVVSAWCPDYETKHRWSAVPLVVVDYAPSGTSGLNFFTDNPF